MEIIMWVVLGLLTGGVIASAAFVWMMRHKMVIATQSQKTFEETCAALEEAVGTEKGWALPIGSWDLFARFQKKHVVPSNFTKLKIYFLCNSALASRVVSDTPAMAGIMPCSWSVYELDDGTVWISRMNIGMMAMMFSGEVGDAMREVEEADQKFLTAAVACEKEDQTPDEEEAA